MLPTAPTVVPRRFLRHGMLPQLAAFHTTLQLGSVTRAVEALCIAQSTLSGQLRKLEEAVGLRLFDRQGKAMLPTPAAWRLAHVAEEVFDAFERGERRLAELREPTAAQRRFPASRSQPAAME